VTLHSSPAEPPPLESVVHAVGEFLRGKDKIIRLVLTALVARGHVLIEDVPGVGKTTLAYGLAKALDQAVSRIQFTSDLLPSDILGVSLYQADRQAFHFVPGPIFADIVLADEVNRASPRTQSALLEAMERGKVTIDGETRDLSRHFFVVATQNPVDHESTFPLPEAQLDRFALRLSIGYPDAATERALMQHGNRRYDELRVAEVTPWERIEEVREKAAGVFLEESLLDYIHGIIGATRKHEKIAVGVSPRGATQFCDLLKVQACLAGRNFVTPEDVQHLAVPALAHRLILTDADFSLHQASEQGKLIREVLASQSVPHRKD
jgi:MoxR-like ATPase